ncbi:hypothetical protein BGZ58_006129 [Dissophora ornata]|nr:hypothetical protein BGZ58_006129 [Dissophora ornata]
MVKFTTLLLASVAILAVSTKAQVSTEPRAISPADLEHWGYSEQTEAPEVEANMVTLERRAVKTANVTLTHEQQTILDTHNKYRALHQAPPLTWNSKSATYGQKWLQQCKFEHSAGPHGENLAAGYPNFKSAINAWYNEVKDYKYSKPGFSGQTGHFTQVVWKSTKTVGCAKKFCPGSNWYIYICEYDPPGNIVGGNNVYFKENVLPIKAK